MKHITAFFFSLRTCLWLLGAMLLLLLAGAFVMPRSPEFQALHSIPLFDWIRGQNAGVTWWLWGVIGVLAFLTVNTVFCSVESVVRKRGVTNWLLLISPQIIHIGFLFMLLAHLLSAAGAYQVQNAAREGSVFTIVKKGVVMKIKDIDIALDYNGQVSDYGVSVEYLSEGRVVDRDVIAPNDPSDKMGLNIIVADVRTYPDEAVLLQFHSEPGAPWALAGAVLFTTGIVTLIILRIRMEKR